jgi:hypothetical protein
MRACVHACMRACVHACMRACVHACMRACVHACMHAFVWVHGMPVPVPGRLDKPPSCVPRDATHTHTHTCATHPLTHTHMCATQATTRRAAPQHAAAAPHLLYKARRVHLPLRQPLPADDDVLRDGDARILQHPVHRSPVVDHILRGRVVACARDSAAQRSAAQHVKKGQWRDAPGGEVRCAAAVPPSCKPL